MSNHFPITPPPELAQQWMTEFYGTPIVPGEACTDLAARAAQWGADQELEACCEWMASVPDFYTGSEIDLRAARRSKPPSLKEQALKALPTRLGNGFMVMIDDKQLGIIRRALEALDD